MVKWVILIGVLAFCLRFLAVADIPKGIYVDDAAIGYNAYSLLLTGKDEYGQKLPLFLKSWNAFTPALVVYFAVVPIKLLGLNVLALRMTPVLLGTLTVLAVGCLAGRKWFLPTTLLLAINPTHILFSRSFYEATLSILLFVIALALNRKHGLMAILFLALSTYAYHSSRLLAYPMLGFWLYQKVRSHSVNKALVVGVVLFALSQIPQIMFTVSTGSSQNLASKSWISEALHQKYWPLAVLREFTAQYLVYYSPRSLFHLPDPDLQRSLPGVSEFFTWLVVPYVLGLLYLAKHWKEHKPLLFLLLIFPIPAALAKDPFSTLRASLGLIPLTIVMAMGVTNLKIRFKPLVLGIFLMLSLLALYRSLFVLLPHERSLQWQYGYQQAFQLVAESGLPAVVDDKKPVYILYLFYQKINPRQVQAAAEAAGTNYYTYHAWENYYHDSHVEFRSLDWKHDVYKRQLIVGGPLLVSVNQAKEHFLLPELAINSLFVYKTQPELKCAAATIFEPQCHQILTK